MRTNQAFQHTTNQSYFKINQSIKLKINESIKPGPTSYLLISDLY